MRRLVLRPCFVRAAVAAEVRGHRGRVCAHRQDAAAGARIRHAVEEQGYRMRARLHVKDGAFGFFREGTHELCDAGPTRQLLPATIDALQRLQPVLAGRALRRANYPKTPPQPSGRCCSSWSLPRPPRLTSIPIDGIPDCCSSIINAVHLTVAYGRRTSPITLRRQTRPVSLTHHVQSFFQGNRYLLPGARQPRRGAGAGGNGHGPLRRRRTVRRVACGARAAHRSSRSKATARARAISTRMPRRTAPPFTCATSRSRAICSGAASSAPDTVVSILRGPACPGRRCRAFSASRCRAWCTSHAIPPRSRATSNDFRKSDTASATSKPSTVPEHRARRNPRRAHVEAV